MAYVNYTIVDKTDLAMIIGSFHPPGDVIALVAVIGSQKIHNLGDWYTIIPRRIGKDGVDFALLFTL